MAFGAYGRKGTVCAYYSRGFCRFGDRCWYEHPQPTKASPQTTGSSRRGEWSGQNQKYTNVVQAGTFSKSSNWQSNRDHGKVSFEPQTDLGLSQNRFTALSSNDDVKDEEEKLLEIIMKDMEMWESSGQWMFSSYSPAKDKPNISGFPEFLPEELHLEYYKCIASNNIQNYISSIQQLVTQWRNRLLELKNMNTVTKTTLISEFKNVAGRPSSGFGGQQAPAFGTLTASFPVNQQSTIKNFSFKPTSELSNVSSGSTAAFGSLTSSQNHSILGTAPSSTVPVGFVNQPSAASFSFKSTATSGGFEASGFSGFGNSQQARPSDMTLPSVFGACNTTAAVSTSGSGNTLFGQSANTSSALASPVIPTSISSEKLFTPKTELSAEELKQFEAKKFTLGKIPLKPPPVELLSVQ